MNNFFLKPSYKLAADSFLEGESKTEACRRAGFKQPKQAGTRIFDREDVKLYIKEKQKKLSQAHDTRKEDIAKWCWQVLDINPVDILVRDEKGNMRIDLGSVKANTNRLFKSGAVEIVETHTTGGKVKSSVKVAGLSQLKAKALDTLCRMYGFYEENVNLKGELSIADALLKGRERVKEEE